jgi:hypothetical protein
MYALRRVCLIRLSTGRTRQVIILHERSRQIDYVVYMRFTVGKARYNCAAFYIEM